MAVNVQYAKMMNL